VEDSRILIVDDNATARALLRDTIQLEGEYDIITAANGLEAVQLALAERPDLILMDLHMPLMDGYEATCALKADLRTADIPVVALTASYVMGEDRERALRAGCAEYLQKPVPRVLLLEKVREHLAS
jgi:CheY-like chemotaxis protein